MRIISLHQAEVKDSPKGSEVWVAVWGATRWCQMDRNITFQRCSMDFYFRQAWVSHVSGINSLILQELPAWGRVLSCTRRNPGPTAPDTLAVAKPVLKWINVMLFSTQKCCYRTEAACPIIHCSNHGHKGERVHLWDSLTVLGLVCT